MAGNVTIFSPLNEAFDKLPIKIENQSLSSLRRLILRHFVKGFLFKRDMENGTVSIKIIPLFLLKVALIPKILKIFFIAHINIPNHYLKQKIGISYLLF